MIDKMIHSRMNQINSYVRSNRKMKGDVFIYGICLIGSSAANFGSLYIGIRHFSAKVCSGAARYLANIQIRYTSISPSINLMYEMKLFKIYIVN